MKPDDASLIPLWIHGSSGRMGKELQQELLGGTTRFRLAGGSSKVFEGEVFHQGQLVTSQKLSHALTRSAVIFDFSSSEGNDLLCEAFALGELKGKGVLIGTTGLSPKAEKRWRQIAELERLQLLFAPNTSLGILLMLKTAILAAGTLVGAGFDVEIVETHHRDKKDAPSGTANMIARGLADSLAEKPAIASQRTGARKKNEIGVHSVRGGAVFGEHELRFIGDKEELSISHRAFSRGLFAQGALVLGEWLVKQQPGVYTLGDIDPASLR